jgi:phosphoribosylformylglycinamidine cyclo-ligase
MIEPNVGPGDAANDPPRPSSYRSAGVDIDRGERAKERIARRVRATHGPAVLRDVGLFGGFYRAPSTDGSPVLVATADSVGTKVLLASLAGEHRGIGIDLVNHCVNDLLATGAVPLFFLDYYATPELDERALEQIVDGMATACQAAGCALIGGETAQLPGIYRDGTYDLAGFMVGQVDEARIVDGSLVRAGDALIGLTSSGLHTNGYSLARSAFGLSGDAEVARGRLDDRPVWAVGRTLADVLLEPHRSYLDEVRPLLERGVIHGLAHVTGGGLAGNLARIIPRGLEAVVESGAWQPPPVFDAIRQAAGVDRQEMFRVFNMGVGMVLIVSSADAAEIAAALADARIIGEIRESAGETRATVSGLAERDGER